MHLNDTNLLQIKPDERVKIVSIVGGHKVRQKINLRGISQGKTVRVVSNYGPITIEVGRSIISMGRGIAQKIRVTRM